MLPHMARYNSHSDNALVGLLLTALAAAGYGLYRAALWLWGLL